MAYRYKNTLSSQPCTRWLRLPGGNGECTSVCRVLHCTYGISLMDWLQDRSKLLGCFAYFVLRETSCATNPSSTTSCIILVNWKNPDQELNPEPRAPKARITPLDHYRDLGSLGVPTHIEDIEIHSIHSFIIKKLRQTGYAKQRQLTDNSQCVNNEWNYQITVKPIYINKLIFLSIVS